MQNRHVIETIVTLQGEDVSLVRDFTGNWKDPMKAVHKEGSRYEVDVSLITM